MKRIVAGVAIVLMTASAASADPLAEARTGKIQCYRPDTARKVCGALSTYVFGTSGITNNAEMLLAPNPPVVMRTSSPVMVKGEAVCGLARKEDIDAAQILMNGEVLPDDKAAGLRAQLASAFQSMFGKEICTTYVPSGDKLSSQVTIDGVPNAAYTQPVIWVSPDDGYKVAP